MVRQKVSKMDYITIFHNLRSWMMNHSANATAVSFGLFLIFASIMILKTIDQRTSINSRALTITWKTGYTMMIAFGIIVIPAFFLVW